MKAKYCDIFRADIAYIAGLFDGEGSIHFKRGTEKKKNTRVMVIVGYRIV